jgi:hypothetical protein
MKKKVVMRQTSNLSPLQGLIIFLTLPRAPLRFALGCFIPPLRGSEKSEGAARMTMVIDNACRYLIKIGYSRRLD